jgi:hypothetical protein
MQPENSIENDQALRNVLRQWEIKDPLPPRFREQVWQRIARHEAQALEPLWTQLFNWIGGLMARPSLAVSYVALLLLTGLFAGYWHARTDTARMSAELGNRYVQMLDPYQAPHH